MSTHNKIITSSPVANSGTVALNIEKVIVHEQDKMNAHGAFPVMMASVNEYIHAEHKAHRITGKEYSTVYLAMLQTTLAQAVTWGLQVDMTNRELELKRLQIDAQTLENDQLVASLDLDRDLKSKELEKTNKDIDLISAKITTDDIINAQLGSELTLKREISQSTLDNHAKSRQEADLSIAAKTINNAQLNTELTLKRDVISEQILLATFDRTFMQPAKLTKLQEDVKAVAQDVAYKITTNNQLNTELQIKRDIGSRQILAADYDRQFIKPQELTNLQNQKLLSDKQILLTGEKAKTETENTQVSFRQALLYTEQAKAFKFKHNRELTNDLINNYVMAQTQAINVSFGSTVYGHNLTNSIQAALWV